MSDRLPRTTFILGGARSGKSRYAEGLALAAGGRPVYLATGFAGDAEMAARIARHREERSAVWETLEEPIEIARLIRERAAPDRPILIDCLTLWLMNLMEADRDIEEETADLAASLGAAGGPVILVANEVGLGLVPESALSRRYRDHAGRINQAVAASADRVVFIAAGLPLVLKDRAERGT